MTVSYVRESTPLSIMHHWIHPSSKGMYCTAKAACQYTQQSRDDLSTAEIAETVDLVQG